MGKLVIDKLCKHFGAVKAVDNVSITVEDGEFLTLLGPSGCGKSTTLFAIAGLDTPTSGRIQVEDTTFFDSETDVLVPPEARNCGLVFQSYALWPHMTVRQNLAFPLKIRKVSKADQTTRIKEAADLVELTELLDRYPHELSGGQQQRVALARTIVYAPRLLLLDEPLSNLDAKLRIKARVWLKELQRRLAITTIYVTHDQSEALSLSDRIAVMDQGNLIQIGTPEEIYSLPASPFVADFIGASNFLAGKVSVSSDDEVTVALSDGRSLVALSRRKLAVGSEVRVAIRPENISLVNGAGAPEGHNVLEGVVQSRDYLGARFQYVLMLGGEEVRMDTEDDVADPAVTIAFSAESCIAFPLEG